MFLCTVALQTEPIRKNSSIDNENKLHVMVRMYVHIIMTMNYTYLLTSNYH